MNKEIPNLSPHAPLLRSYLLPTLSTGHPRWREKELVSLAQYGSQNQSKLSDVWQMTYAPDVAWPFPAPLSVIFGFQRMSACCLKTFVCRSSFGGFLIHRGYRLMTAS